MVNVSLSSEFYYDTVESVDNGHPRDRLECLLCTDDRYIQVGYNVGSHIGTYQMWLL